MIKTALPLGLALALAAPGLTAAQSTMSADEMAKALGLTGPAAETRPGKPKFRAPSFEITPAESLPPPTAAAAPSIALKIEFEVDSARVRPEYLGQVQQIDRLLREHPGLTLAIVGHTDASGEAGHNQVLSERRAEAVRTMLISRGVSSSRLTAAGRGESAPLEDVSPDNPRNRRVEFTRTDLR